MKLWLLALTIFLILIQFGLVSSFLSISPSNIPRFQDPFVNIFGVLKIKSSFELTIAKVVFLDFFKNYQRNSIQSLRKQKKIVICKLSLGTVESTQLDIHLFANHAGEVHSLKPEKYWLNIKDFEKSGLGNAIQQRIDLAYNSGCSGILGEDLNSFQFPNDFEIPITMEEQIKFNKFVADHAHYRNLSVALYNNPTIANQTIDFYDFAFSDQNCFVSNNCDYLESFIKQNKAVFGITYSLDLIDPGTSKFNLCKEQIQKKYSWMVINSLTLQTDQIC